MERVLISLTIEEGYEEEVMTPPTILLPLVDMGVIKEVIEDIVEQIINDLVHRKTVVGYMEDIMLCYLESLEDSDAITTAQGEDCIDWARQVYSLLADKLMLICDDSPFHDELDGDLISLIQTSDCQYLLTVK